MKELWQILMNFKDWAKGSPIKALVLAILMRKFYGKYPNKTPQ
jgi:hypothetical protein